jgi:protein-S-isoprenylcysteine O-methyltransferase Ste14
METILRTLVIAALLLVGFAMVRLGGRHRGNPLGRPPIGRLPFLVAKLTAGIPVVLIALAAVFDPPRHSFLLSVVVACLLVCGSILFVLSLRELGGSLRVGLPSEETALVTSGVYRHSRNPIYVSLFILLSASLTYAFSWLNLCAVVAYAILHHRIILAEEKFLAGRFPAFEDYRRRVRRYV